VQRTALHCFYLSDSFCCLLHGFLTRHLLLHWWCDIARHRVGTSIGRRRDELKRLIIDSWSSIQQAIIDQAINQ